MRIHRTFALPLLSFAALCLACGPDFKPDRLEDLGGPVSVQPPGADSVPDPDPDREDADTSPVDEVNPQWVCQQRAQSCGVAPSGEACGSCIGGEVCDGTRCLPPDAAPARSCTADGWCWVHPRDPALLFSGAPGALRLELKDLWAAAEDDVWLLAQDPAVDGAAFLHFNGQAWSRVDSPPFPPLHGLWGSGPNDAHAVGERGALAHWDGSGWSAHPKTFGAEPLLDVFGTDRTNVYAGGLAGQLLRWDGGRWAELSDPAFTSTVWSIAGRDSFDVWFALADGAVVFFDGVAFHRLPAPGTLPAQGRARVVSTREDVWWMGAEGALFRLDGEAWQRFPSMPSLQAATSLAEHQGALYTAAGDGVFRFQGGAWTRQQVGLERLSQPAEETGVGPLSIHRVGSRLYLVGTVRSGDQLEGFILEKQ